MYLKMISMYKKVPALYTRHIATAVGLVEMCGNAALCGRERVFCSPIGEREVLYVALSAGSPPWCSPECSLGLAQQKDACLRALFSRDPVARDATFLR